MGQASTRQEHFWEACSYGREWLVKQMIAEGIDINWVSHIHDCCPIHVASQGKPNVVKLLLEAGCKVDSRDNKENTALHHASMSGDAQVVKLLLDAGADVNAVNNKGWTPLFNACYWNRSEVVEILMEYSADIELTNNDGRNALHELCRSKSGSEEDLLKILEILIACDIDVNAKSARKNSWDSEADFSPLLFASYHGHGAVAERILLAGGDLYVTDMNGWSALHWASQRRHKDLVALLIDHGADIYSRGIRGETAADSTNDEVIKDLLAPPYPVIISNGYVTTDDEDGDSMDSVSLTDRHPPPAFSDEQNAACLAQAEVIAGSLEEDVTPPGEGRSIPTVVISSEEDVPNGRVINR